MLKEIKVNKMLGVELTDKEVAVYADNLSNEVKNHLDVKTEAKKIAKEFKDRLDKIDFDLKAFATKVRTKKEFREIPCEWRVDFDRNSKTLVRLDTNEKVETRILTVEERQLVLEGMMEGTA